MKEILEMVFLMINGLVTNERQQTNTTSDPSKTIKSTELELCSSRMVTTTSEIFRMGRKAGKAIT